MRNVTLTTLSILLVLSLACGGGGSDEHEGSAPPSSASSSSSSSAPVTPAAQPTPGPAAASTKGQLPGYSGRFASDPLLTPQQVALIPPSELRKARNEVFARYGRPFKSADLQAHFKATSWYQEKADFSESVLTKNDHANVALIQSFEGDSGKKKALSQVEYYGDGDSGISFVSAASAELMDGSGDMYNWSRESRNWMALGDWVVTWEGGAKTWDPNSGVRSAQLWKLNHADGSIVEVYDLSPRQG